MNDNHLLSIQNQLATLAQDGASLDALTEPLAALWDEAEARGDQMAVARLQDIWNTTQALDNHRQHLAGVAQAAVEVANEMIQQRDQIADALSDVVNERDAVQSDFDEYRDQVRSLDHDNPDVAIMSQEIEGELLQYWMSEGVHSSEPGSDIVSTGLFPGLNESAAEDFAYVLFGMQSDLPKEMYVEAQQFITSFSARANAHWDAERQRWIAKQKAQAS